jgi:hypothetical protein
MYSSNYCSGIELLTFLLYTINSLIVAVLQNDISTKYLEIY